MQRQVYKAGERAELTVDGGKFEDWTSVWVQKTWGNAYDQFKFTCAERDGASPSQVNASSRFKPGMKCTIKLAGEEAITGTIITRQVAYDANSRGVQLQGTSRVWQYATSSVDHETNNYDGKKFEEIVKEVLEKTGCKYKFEGKPSEKQLKPFPYCTSEKGETNFAFLQRLANNRSVMMTSDEEGQWIFVYSAEESRQGELIEGKNILKMQAVASCEYSYKDYLIDGSINATDEMRYRKASEQRVEAKGAGEYSKDLDYHKKITPVEQPDTEEGLEIRRDAEMMWDIGTELNATVVVYGWQPDPEAEEPELWKPGAKITIKSPMAMIDQEMAIQSVTFTQDNNSGTTTTLVCVKPGALPGPKAGH